MAPDPTKPSSNMTPESPEIIAFASRMYDAARAGDLPTFQSALPAGLPANLTNSSGDSLLMLASYHGHLPLTRFLLEHGADPNRLNDRAQSPLAGAVFKGADEIVEALLEGGADVDAGQPSAMQSVEIFKGGEKWGEKFRAQRERLSRLKEGGASGPGGTKEGTQVV